MDETMVGREVWTWAAAEVGARPVRPRLMRYELDDGEQGEWLNLRAVGNPADVIPAVDSRPNMLVYDREIDALMDWREVVQEHVRREPAPVYPLDRCMATRLGVEPRPATAEGVLTALDRVLAERDEARARVAELEAAARWIPVSARLPEDGFGVLVYGNNAVGTAFRWAGRWMDLGGILEGVTHWRPMPAPPEVEP